MKICIGSSGMKLTIGKELYQAFSPVTIFTPTDIISLQSSDNYILTDLNGVYLLPKESD